MLTTWIAERSLRDNERNAVIMGINFSQLPYFMLSNLLTGVVNLTMETIFVGGFAAFAAIVVYQLVACRIIWELYLRKIKIKRW